MTFEASPLAITMIVFLGLLTLAFAIKFLVPALLLQGLATKTSTMRDSYSETALEA